MTPPREAKLLFSVSNVLVYSLEVPTAGSKAAGGKRTSSPRVAVENGIPQTLNLFMVSTEERWGPHGAVEEDFYLSLSVADIFLDLPASTQIYHKPPTSYIIPRWDKQRRVEFGVENREDSGQEFLELEFPKIGNGITQEDMDTFETILAQCTAFLERAQPPSDGDTKKYDPSAYKPGEAYVKGTGNRAGQIVLVDEENGSVMGELAEGAQIVEHPGIEHGSKSMESPQSRFSEQFPKLTVYRSC